MIRQNYPSQLVTEPSEQQFENSACQRYRIESNREGSSFQQYQKEKFEQQFSSLLLKGIKIHCKKQQFDQNSVYKQEYYKKIFDIIKSKKARRCFANYLALNEVNSKFYQYSQEGDPIDKYWCQKRSRLARLILFKQMIELVKELQKLDMAHLDIKMGNIIFYKGSIRFIDLEDVLCLSNEFKQPTVQRLFNGQIQNGQIFMSIQLFQKQKFFQGLDSTNVTQQEMSKLKKIINKISIQSLKRLAPIVFESDGKDYLNDLQKSKSIKEFFEFVQLKMTDSLEFCLTCCKINCNHRDSNRQKDLHETLSIYSIFEMNDSNNEEVPHEFMSYKKNQFLVAFKKLLYSQKTVEHHEFVNRIQTKVKIWMKTTQIMKLIKKLKNNKEFQNNSKGYNQSLFVKQFQCIFQNIRFQTQQKDHLLKKATQLFSQLTQYQHYYAINQFYLTVIEQQLEKNHFSTKQQIDQSIQLFKQEQNQEYYYQFLSKKLPQLQKKIKEQQIQNREKTVERIGMLVNSTILKVSNKQNYKTQIDFTDVNFPSFTNIIQMVIKCFIQVAKIKALIFGLNLNNFSISTQNNSQSYHIYARNNILILPNQAEGVEQRTIYRKAIQSKIHSYLFNSDQQSQFLNDQIIQRVIKDSYISQEIYKIKKKVNKNKIKYDSYCLLNAQAPLEQLKEKIIKRLQQKFNQYNLYQLSTTLKLLFSLHIKDSKKVKQELKESLADIQLKTFESYHLQLQRIKQKYFWQFFKNKEKKDHRFDNISQQQLKIFVETIQDYIESERKRFYLFQNVENKQFCQLNKLKSLLVDLSKIVSRIEHSSLKNRTYNPLVIEHFMNSFMNNYPGSNYQDQEKDKNYLLKLIDYFSKDKIERQKRFDLYLIKNFQQMYFVEKRLEKCLQKLYFLDNLNINNVNVQNEFQKLGKARSYKTQVLPIFKSLDDKIQNFKISEQTVHAVQKITFKDQYNNIQIREQKNLFQQQQIFTKAIDEIKKRLLDFPKLKQIYITGKIYQQIQRVDQSFLEQLSQKNIQIFNLYQSSYYKQIKQYQQCRSIEIDQQSLQQDLMIAPKVVKIKMHMNSSLKSQDQLLKMLNVKLMNPLLSLTLSKLKNISQQIFADSSLKQLRQLHLCDIGYKGEYFRGYIFQKFKQLIKLSILQSSQTTNHYLAHYNFKLKKLKQLILHNCPFITSIFIQKVLCNNKYLQILDLKSTEIRDIKIDIPFDSILREFMLENFNIEQLRSYQLKALKIHFNNYKNPNSFNYKSFFSFAHQKYVLNNCSKQIAQGLNNYCLQNMKMKDPAGHSSP